MGCRNGARVEVVGFNVIAAMLRRNGFRVLWVTDSAAHVVHKFSPDGRLVMTLGKKGVAGDNTSRDLFNQPNHVALAPNGDIYVSDGYEE